MEQTKDSSQLPISAAIFCPQNKPPKAEYIASIRRYLLDSPVLEPFTQAIIELPTTWQLFVHNNANIAVLDWERRPASQHPQQLSNWLQVEDDENSLPCPDVMSGVLALPILTIIQIVQYFQYLDLRGITHMQFLEEIRIGGAQGFCGGLLPAMAIAASKCLADVVQNAAKSLRIALGIGAYGELGDDPDALGPTTLVLRAKHAGQAENIVASFPGAYVSAVTDPLSISIVGPVNVLEDLKAYAETAGLPVTQVNLRGKVHNPENRELCAELCRLCDEKHELLGLPSADDLLVPVRSNSTGKCLQGGKSLTHEVVRSTLVSRCEWYDLLTAVSLGLKTKRPQKDAYLLAMFGTGRKNCVPSTPFEANGLRVTKLDVMNTVAAGAVNRPGLESHPKDSIAIVGAACRLPGADSLEDLWDLVREGKSMAKELPLQRLNGRLSSRLKDSSTRQHWYGNFIDDISSFDNAFFNISPREAQYMDPQQRLLLETAYQALDSSGYLRHHRRDDFDNVGCFIGSTYTEYLENTTVQKATAYSGPGTIRAFQNGRISYYFGWSGPSEAIDTACSSSLVAIHRACRAIQAGECPMALAGGVNIITGINNFLDLGKAGFLSTTGQCKPFDQSADGYCRADGVGLVVLKSLIQAISEGDNILGVIPAVATNHGGLSQSITAPYSRAQTQLFHAVLKRSGLRARQISYVEAHGTGTQVGDPIEVASIREVFGGAQREGEALYIGSLKANVGHSETAAGVGSLLKVLAMLQHQGMPPLAGFHTLNPKIPPLELDHLNIPYKSLTWKPSPTVKIRAALVNSYGAAGSNSALICCEAPSPTSSVAHVASEGGGDSELSYPIFLSAATAESLGMNAAHLAAYIRRKMNEHGSLRVGDLALTLHERRKHHPLRLVYTTAGLGSLAQSLEADANSSSDLLRTSACADNSAAKPIILVFSGQSKQTIRLHQTWYQRFPRLRFHIDRCDKVLRDLGHPSILAVIFQSEPVTDVVALQCGTFVVQYACAMSWIDCGLDPAALVGHSFGELTAMAVGGVYSLEDGLKLVAERASLMKTRWSTERGTMLAIHASKEVVEDLVTEVVNKVDSGSSLELEIACYNGPRSQVVVGSDAAIKRAQQVMDQDARFSGVQRQLIDVSHGFHSVFTEPILKDLDSTAKALTFHRPTIPVETCTKPGSSPEEPEYLEAISHELIIRHTRMPVYFGDAISRLEQRLGSSCLWLEAGTDSPVIAMTKRALKTVTNHILLPIKAEADENAITVATATLWREGIDHSFWAFTPPIESGFRPIWLPPYQFQKKQHWLEWKDVGHEVHKTVGNHRIANTGHVLPLHSATPLGTMPDSWTSHGFVVHTDTSRFTEIVSGHAVRGHPLCPASMYMECVVMAAQLIKPEISSKTLRFDNMSFTSALGLGHDRRVTLAMEGAGEYLNWGFTFSSSLVNGDDNTGIGMARSKSSRPIIHANGKFSVMSQTHVLQLHERIMAEHIQHLAVNLRAEKLNSRRAYALFSRVVDYNDVLRGISHMTIMDNHAVAQVRRPKAPVSSVESTASAFCDTVTIDTFIQVVGLLINSSEACPDSEVFIATGIDSLVIQDCDFSKHDEWSVYAMMSSSKLSEQESQGDMLAFTADGKLVLTGSGIKFTRYSIAKLERLLHSVSSRDSRSSASLSKAALNKSTPSLVQKATTKPAHSALPAETDLDGDEAEQQTVVSSESMSTDSFMKNMGYLGLDSLSTTELRARIGGKSVVVPKEQMVALLAKSPHHNTTRKSLPSSDESTGDDLGMHAESVLWHRSVMAPRASSKLRADDHLQRNDNEVSGLNGLKGQNRSDILGTSPKMRIQQRILELVSENCGEPLVLTSIEDTVSLQDIGVDSLSVVELASSIEESFGIDYGGAGLDLQSTIAEIVGDLSQKAAK